MVEDAEREAECIELAEDARIDADSDSEADADADGLGLAMLVSLPELDAVESCDGVTLNCSDWARMPPPADDTKLTW